jgi:hypothetical protein
MGISKSDPILAAIKIASQPDHPTRKPAAKYDKSLPIAKGPV